jgi:phage shock protein PspC (stress-responsive transcriptional regulator)
MAVYCHQCGTGLPPTARFCSNCGSAIHVPQPIPGRPLMRPREGRQIAGVCIALARANGWDVAVVRILAVIGLCISGGLFGVAYLACWIGIPEEPLMLPSSTYPPGGGGYPPSI